jgi:hypothetical protein
VGSFRFRRTIKIAPGVRLNINKKSVGLSAGVPGARISKNSDGRSTRSVGIPGSGLYWREQTGPHSGSSAPTPQQHANDLAEVWARAQDPDATDQALADLADAQRQLAEDLADTERQAAESIQTLIEIVSGVSIDVPTLDGGSLSLSFTLTPETYAYMNDQVEQRVVWEGCSPADHQLAGDPKYADWTMQQVVEATVEQSVRLMQEVRREVIIDAVTTNDEIVAAVGEAEAPRAAERLADAIEAATSSS